jgi:NtrC-family two-component system response regulator AlgB
MEFLIIDDDKIFRDAACLLIEDAGHHAEGAANSEAGLLRLKEDNFDAVLLDLNLGAEDGLAVLSRISETHPRVPVVMVTAAGSVKTAVEAMRRGAADYLEKPFTREHLLTVVARLQRLHQLGRRIDTLEEEVRETRSKSPAPLFDFDTPVMKGVMEIMDRAAGTPASVLILGESGTGKSVAARALHQKSHLADRPFVTVSCPSLSRELLESELFGHVKGAFTGAVKDHWGKVRSAEGGTLFLDEIGDLPMEIQPKLLRLLQEREYERLGENVTRRADVRVIAATNRDLKQRVREGAFREDLYYRLNVIAVEMPPLRARQGDLIRFAEHYLRHFASQCGRKIQGFADSALELLRAHTWPGNLRELSNCVERAAILARGEWVGAEDLPAEVRGGGSLPAPEIAADHSGGALISLAQLEEAHIRRVVAGTRSLAEAAEVLGIDQATLYRKRKRMGL